jgi:hypothetical protein
MGRIGKLKKEMIAEANIRLLNEQPVDEGLNISDNQNFLKKIDIYNKKQNGK